MRAEPGVENRVQIGRRSVDDGDTGTPDRCRHVGVGEGGLDDGLGFCHDLFGSSVVDVQTSLLDVVEPDSLQPFLPGLYEPVPGLRAVADDGEAPRRAAT